MNKAAAATALNSL